MIFNDRIMKRIIYSLLLSLCGLVGMAQTGELMRIYLDKECYLAGEDLWIKVCVDDEVYPGNSMSRVAYVEICDTAKVHVQAKVDLRGGVGWARVSLPQTMHSGIYQLTTYTRYMRNLNSDSFPRKYVAVLNTRGASEEDHFDLVDSIADVKTASGTSVGSASLKGDKKMYGVREKVSLSWSSMLDAKELTLSVFRKDCMVNLPQAPKSVLASASSDQRWIAECEGHIVTGKLESTEYPEDLTAQLSCVGKSVRIFEGARRENGIFRFYTHGVNNQQDIVLSSRSLHQNKSYRMQIVSPFEERLPQALPSLSCHYEDSELIARSIALQLTQAMPKGVLSKELEDVVYGQPASKSYNLDEYVRFGTLRECIVEFVMGVSVQKENKQEIIRLLKDDYRDYNMFSALVLIDGVVFPNHTEFLEYDARRIHYIHQYRGNYTIGGNVYGGILSVITHRGTLSDVRISNDLQMLAYEFPQNRPSFDMPLYDEVNKMSRKPDFRHTMYWNPSVEGQSSVEFYTSDLEGKYIAVLQGITGEGKKIEEHWEFEVK